MELADDGEHSRWNAKASQDSSQESTKDGVIGFCKVDKAHDEQRCDNVSLKAGNMRSFDACSLTSLSGTV